MGLSVLLPDYCFQGEVPLPTPLEAAGCKGGQGWENIYHQMVNLQGEKTWISNSSYGGRTPTSEGHHVGLLHEQEISFCSGSLSLQPTKDVENKC